MLVQFVNKPCVW